MPSREGLDRRPDVLFTDPVAEMWPETRIREWFTDARGGVRRMQVSHHPEDGLVVFSLWDGARCRGTFRMAVEDATRLLHDFVDVVASPSTRQGQLPSPAAATVGQRVRSLWIGFVRRNRECSLAPVLHLRDRRR